MNPQSNVMDVNDESSSPLAALLKYHNDDGVVIRFDTDMLRKKCMRTSPDFLTSIDLDRALIPPTITFKIIFAHISFIQQQISHALVHLIVGTSLQWKHRHCTIHCYFYAPPQIAV